jgi:uncharacterized damage-inducible protein DinB
MGAPLNRSVRRHASMMGSKGSNMKATGDQATILAQFVDGPTQLENAIRGLSESELDLSPSQGGWSIREIIHHVADGDDIWKSCIKMALGNEQAEFHLDWYWTIPQTTWAYSWAYAHRSVISSLDLLKAARKHILELLAQRPDGWERSVDIREPNGQITRVSVGFVVEMQTDHVFHHMKRILAIRRERGA